MSLYTYRILGRSVLTLAGWDSSSTGSVSVAEGMVFTIEGAPSGLNCEIQVASNNNPNPAIPISSVIVAGVTGILSACTDANGAGGTNTDSEAGVTISVYNDLITPLHLLVDRAKSVE
jgi:hypothetical protein